MIIDVHNHIGKSVDGAECSLDELLSVLEANGIDRTVLFPVDEAKVGKTYERQNDVILKAQEDYPDRIIGFARVSPNAGVVAVEELQRCIDQGLHGLKLHPKSDNFDPDDARPVLEVANQLQLPVIVHIEHLPHCRPKAWQPVFASFTRARFVMAHGGKDLFREAAEVTAALDHVSIETSTLSYNRSRNLLDLLGPKRILFGSDYPYSHPAVELKKWEVILSDEEAFRAIHYENALKYLNHTENA